MEAVTVRLADKADFKIIYDFINLLEDDHFEEGRQRYLFEENLANPDILYLLTFEENEAVGFLSCHIQNLLHHSGKVGEIQEMFVAEKARRLGVGKKLLDELKAIAAAQNLIQLEVTSSLKRSDAHRFYERENFNFTHKKFTLKNLS